MSAPALDFGAIAEALVALAREHGDRIQSERARPGGPRGHGGAADVDVEIERAVRDELERRFPGFGVVGEELPARDRPAAPGRPTLYLDPNDGTRDFLRGWRGSTLCLGVAHEGRPVVGVVYAPCAPSDSGDLMVWAEGWSAPLRNGRPMTRRWPAAMSPDVVAVVTPSAALSPEAYGSALAPVRFRVAPGIAYRICLVAAGEADLTVGLSGCRELDVVAAHAVLRGAGGALWGSDGVEMVYGRGERFDLWAGAPALLPELQRRWSRASPPPQPEPEHLGGLIRPGYGLARVPRPTDGGALDRAQGAWLGQLAGDALGSAVECWPAARVAAEYPSGVHAILDLPRVGLIAGQPTDDSELARALALSVLEGDGYDDEAAARRYAAWLVSGPFSLGRTTRRALAPAAAAVTAGASVSTAAREHADPESQANGALMRVSPLGIWGAAPGRQTAALQAARLDAALTHPHPVCADANAAFVWAMTEAIAAPRAPARLYADTVRWAEGCGLHPDVLATLRAAEAGVPPLDGPNQGWVRLALHNAFHELALGDGPAEALPRTVSRGGDTDTNAAIAGALLGAVHGRDAIPRAWQRALLTCRPRAGDPRVLRPRPAEYWPVDALLLPEALLAAPAPHGERVAAPS